ncbi:MAG: hypothetical protein WAK29_02000 [Terriglobales bacterium]
MMAREKRCSHRVIQMAAAALISVCSLQLISVAQTTDADAAAQENWRAYMSQNTMPVEGCYQASYPDTVWEQVECKEVHPDLHPHPVFSKPADGGDVVGNGKDYVAQSAGLTSSASGLFVNVTGVKSEKSVGVKAFGGGGILGPNEYTLQLNTNYTGTTAACAGHTGCTVWQQFLYATDYETKGEAAVFMQYWLLNWGDSPCPTGFGNGGNGNCYGNSNYIAAPDVNITSLGSLSLTGATASGSDVVLFEIGTTAYQVVASDSVLDISKVWQQSEFNVVGDAGGSRADFNTPVSVTVFLALTDGSSSAPKCVANAGSTGETNNLTLGKCSAGVSAGSPYIEFTEKN